MTSEDPDCGACQEDLSGASALIQECMRTLDDIQYPTCEEQDIARRFRDFLRAHEAFYHGPESM